ncbi:MAG: hypothetical protein ACYTG0_09845 [Planctomycetota bacterium]|jgi:hypothetical protein
MIGMESHWDYEESDESWLSDSATGCPQDDWDDPEPGSLGDDVWDAFDLDDAWENPDPEPGDFWPETDHTEETL